MKKLTALFAVLCLTFSFICPYVAYAGAISPPVTQGSTTVTAVIPSEHKLTVSTVQNGTVLYNGTDISGKTVDVTRHSDVTLTFGAKSGYRVSKVTKLIVNGVDVTAQVSGNSYTLKKVYEDTTIAVTVEVVPYIPSQPVPTPVVTPTPKPTPTPTVKPSATPSAGPTTSPSVQPSASPDITPAATPTAGTQPTPTPAQGSEVTDDTTVIISGPVEPTDVTSVPDGQIIVINGGTGENGGFTPEELERISRVVWPGWLEYDSEVMPKAGFINSDGEIIHNGTAYSVVSLNYTIHSTVYRGGKPLPGVKVELHSTPRVTYTDKNGNFTFENVEPGEHTITVYENDVAVGGAELHLIPCHIHTINEYKENSYIITIPVTMDEIECDVHVDNNVLKITPHTQQCNWWWLVIAAVVIIIIVAKKRKKNEE